jgi:hypothetical protein
MDDGDDFISVPQNASPDRLLSPYRILVGCRPAIGNRRMVSLFALPQKRSKDKHSKLIPLSVKMKLSIVLLALAIVLPCRAEIGDSAKQAIERLGEPTQRLTTGEKEFSLEWKKDNLWIDYHFLHGDAVTSEHFMLTWPNRLSLDKARSLVAEELDLPNWSEAPFGSKVAWRSKHDKRGAVYNSRGLYIVIDVGWVEADVNATSLEWKQAMNLPKGTIE